jgi:hypothetical protein
MPTPSKPISHNDDPVDEDTLLNSDFIKEIAEVVRDCHPPKGIGINGYWGTGKTSALRQLRGKLVEDFPKKIVPIWFEAWRYQYEPLPIVALLNEIRSSIGLWSKFIQQSKKLTGVTLLGVLGAFDKTIEAASAGIIAPQLGRLAKTGEHWENQRHQSPLPSENINKLLEHAIDKALNNSNNSPTNKKLVIFIDDLDRCMPETALKLLEGIKIYLNLNNCVVIFGMDQRQIEQGLSQVLGLTENDDQYGDHYAHEYLEKICQDIYHLPLPNIEKKQHYLISLLTALDLGNADQQALLQLKKVLLKYNCLPANPRKIKALANRLAVLFRRQQFTEDELIENSKIHREYALLMAMTIIYIFHRQLNEQLVKNPEYINEVLLYAQGSTIHDNALGEPMKGIKPSFDGNQELPTNPSDSNVFRLHQLFIDLKTVTKDEITKFLGK